MKKFLFLMLALSMILCLAACGENEVKQEEVVEIEQVEEVEEAVDNPVVMDNTMKGEIVENVELVDVKIDNNKVVFDYNELARRHGDEREGEKIIEIKDIEANEIRKAIFFSGSQLVASSKIAILTDNGLYLAQWHEEDMLDENGNPSIGDTMYAEKLETKGDIQDIKMTTLFTGDVMTGYQNFVLVEYNDGSFEEIYVINNQMAS